MILKTHAILNILDQSVSNCFRCRNDHEVMGAAFFIDNNHTSRR